MWVAFTQKEMQDAVKLAWPSLLKNKLIAQKYLSEYSDVEHIHFGLLNIRLPIIL